MLDLRALPLLQCDIICTGASVSRSKDRLARSPSLFEEGLGDRGRRFLLCVLFRFKGLTLASAHNHAMKQVLVVK